MCVGLNPGAQIGNARQFESAAIRSESDADGRATLPLPSRLELPLR